MASLGPNNVNIFVKGADGALWSQWWAGTAWGGFGKIGGDIKILYGPVSVSRATTSLSVFTVSADHTLHHTHWDSTTSWSNHTSLGGRCVGHPAVSRRGNGTIDIFVLGTDQALYHKSWDGKTWFPSTKEFEKLGGTFVHAPAAVSWGPEHVAVFAVDVKNCLHHARWSPKSGWLPFEKLEGMWKETPKVITEEDGNIHVFGTDFTSTIHELKYTADGWAPIQTLPGVWYCSPEVITRGPGKMDMFAVGYNCHTYHSIWDEVNGKWGPWADYGSGTQCAPRAVSHSELHVSVFIIGTDNGLWARTTRANGTWPYDWEGLGGVCFGRPG